MRQIILYYICFVLVFWGKTYSEPINIFKLEQFSRTIQVDALLVEWKSDNSRKINNLTIDAAVTSEDFIGYAHFPLSKNKKVKEIKFSTRNSNFDKTIYLDSAFQFEDVALDFVKIDDTSRAAVFEWQLPLVNFVSNDSDSLNITFKLIGIEDSVLSTIQFEGLRNQNSNNDSSPLIPQAILILLLLIIFILMKKKIRKKYSN